MNVYHVFTNPLAVNVTVAVHLTPFIVGVVPDVCQFPSNAILYVFSVTNDSAVTLLLGIVNVVCC